MEETLFVKKQMLIATPAVFELLFLTVEIQVSSENVNFLKKCSNSFLLQEKLCSKIVRANNINWEGISFILKNIKTVYMKKNLET